MQMNVKRGLTRLGIVAAVLWFAFWGLRAFMAYQDYQTASAATDYIGRSEWMERAWYGFIGNLLAAVIWPVIAALVLFVALWIWRGFRGASTDV